MPSLTVRVVGGRDIPWMDNDGKQKSDPYVVLTVKDDMQKTKTKWNTDRPTWDESFKWAKINGDEVLQVGLWDEDVTKMHDPISSTEISLRDLVPGKPKDGWFRMTPAHGVQKGGNLRLVLQVDA